MAQTSHTTLLSVHTRHAERVFDKSHGLDGNRREALFKRVLNKGSHRVTRRLHQLEMNKASIDGATQALVDKPIIVDRDVNADIQIQQIVNERGGLRIRGVLLNYPVESIIGSVVTTLPIRRLFKYRSFIYVETSNEKRVTWYRVHGDLTLLDKAGLTHTVI